MVLVNKNNRDGSNGSWFVLFWRNQISILKFLVCCFLVANIFYFAIRYHELLLTVKRLEAENFALTNSLEKGKQVNKAVIAKYEKKEAAVIAGEPILEYSQVKI